jgi:hypothetical protein
MAAAASPAIAAIRTSAEIRRRFPIASIHNLIADAGKGTGAAAKLILVPEAQFFFVISLFNVHMAFF